MVLIGGDPGIGKSTLLLQALASLSQAHQVLYVSGEESLSQVALRANRLGVDGSRLPMLAEISLERINAAIQQHRPSVVVIDSIQTVFTEQLQSAPGSVAQVRDCAAQLTRMAKQQGVTVVMIGHVTKEGALAGPRVLEHMVDTVLYFEGDNHSTFRLVRAIKNRFGAVNELGVFAMTDRGLRAVSNPSALFLSQHAQPVPGSCVLVTQEGTPADAGRRSRRWSTPPTRRSRAGCRWARRRPARAAAGGAAPACRHPGLRPGRLRQCGRRACASPSRPPTSRSCWPSCRR